MKKLFFSVLTVLSLHSVLHAQLATTQEEYNYITKGWKNHLEDGSDVKAGYEMRYLNSGSLNYGNGQKRTAKLYQFIKTGAGQNRTVAYMIEYGVDDKAKEYICIPHPSSNATILNQYVKTLADGSSDVSFRLQIITTLLTTQLKW